LSSMRCQSTFLNCTAVRTLSCPIRLAEHYRFNCRWKLLGECLQPLVDLHA